MSPPGHFARDGDLVPLYEPELFSALQSLDKLIDWEKLRRSTTPLSAGFDPRMRVTPNPSQQLLKRLGSPQNSFKSVHVSGSKGKGTVAALITAALMCRPFTDNPATQPVGTYGSPHVERFNERMLVNQVPLSDQDIAVSINTVIAARSRYPVIDDATWFDVVTATGINAFRSAAVQRAVLEVGLGGRLDSTNALNAPVAVITNIQFEHAEIIGPTLKDIAYEKAGIIAPGAHVVVGMSENDALAPIFIDEANRHERPASIWFQPPCAGETIFQTNLRLARAAIDAVAEHEGVNVDSEMLMSEEFAHEAQAILPARQERFTLSEGLPMAVPVLLDGSHVPESVHQLLTDEKLLSKPVVLLALGKEKNPDAMSSAIVPFASLVVTTTFDNQRCFTATELADCVRSAGGTVQPVSDPIDALKSAASQASEANTSVVIVGSFYLAGRLRNFLRQRCIPNNPLSS